MPNPLGAKVCCFKPQDEEPFMPNNPRDSVFANSVAGQSMRHGIPPGMACFREVAAFLLDTGIK